MGSTQLGQDQTKGICYMQISVNKFHFYPDEIISGKIKLYPKNNMINYSNILNLNIEFSISQKEYWQDHNNLINLDANKNINNANLLFDEGTDPDDVNHLTENVLLTKTLTFQNSQMKNGIIISFQLRIPTEVKPSFEFLSSPQLYAYSRTFLNIKILETQNESKLLLFILKKPTPLQSDLTISKNCSKKILGLFGNANKISFSGTYPKNNYCFGEICPLNIKINASENSEKINNITVSLKRKIQFISGKKSLINLAKKYVENLWEYRTNQFGYMQEFNLNFNIPLSDNQLFSMKRKSNFVDLNSISRNYLSCLLPSFMSNLIKCEYYIKTEIVFDSLLIKNESFIMPLDLGHGQNLYNQNSMLDINKIFSQYSTAMISSIMDINSEMLVKNNNSNINSNENNIINISEENKVFGDIENLSNPNIINNYENQNVMQINQNTPNQNENTEEVPAYPSLDEITTNDEKPAPGIYSKP